MSGTITSGSDALGVGSSITPGGAVTSTVYTQLAFDPRINKQAMLRGSTFEAVRDPRGGLNFNPATGLTQGFVVQAQSQTTSDGSLYGCAFLFNPSIVTLQHGIDSNSSLVLPQYRRLKADTGVYVIGLASTLDFSLYFDRTYEVNTAAQLPGGVYAPYMPLGYLRGSALNAESNAILTQDDPRIVGVKADINALYRVVGMSDPVTGVTWTNDDGSSSKATLTGPMQQVPVYLMLGANMAGSLPYWYGYIDSIGVTYTHFSQGMVPMRAQVDVEMTLLPTAS